MVWINQITTSRQKFSDFSIKASFSYGLFLNLSFIELSNGSGVKRDQKGWIEH